MEGPPVLIRRTACLCLLPLLLVTAGCGLRVTGSRQVLLGTFVSTRDPGDLVRFKLDGEFTLNVANTYAGRGTYRVDGQRVVLDIAGGDRFTMRIRRQSGPRITLVDSKGVEWIFEEP